MMTKVREAIVKQNEKTIELLECVLKNLKSGDAKIYKCSMQNHNYTEFPCYYEDSGDFWERRKSSPKYTITLDLLRYKDGDEKYDGQKESD